MILDAPSPKNAIWPPLERRHPQGRRRAARLLARLGRPLPFLFLCMAAGLWSLPAIAVFRIDLDRAVAGVTRALERRPMLTCLGFAAAALYVGATGLLLAFASRGLARTWRPAARAMVRVVLAPAILLSLAAWIALATGCFLAALLWLHRAWT